jgi:hypothetical protein
MEAMARRRRRVIGAKRGRVRRGGSVRFLGCQRNLLG